MKNIDLIRELVNLAEKWPDAEAAVVASSDGLEREIDSVRMEWIEDAQEHRLTIRVSAG